jgi:hypothetical protein
MLLIIGADHPVHLPLVITHAQWSAHYYGQSGLSYHDTEERIWRITSFQSAYNRVMAHNTNPNKTYTMQLGRLVHENWLNIFESNSCGKYGISG